MAKKVTLEVTKDELWVMKMALNGYVIHLDKRIEEEMVRDLEAGCKEKKELAQGLGKFFERKKELTQNLLGRLKNGMRMSQ